MADDKFQTIGDVSLKTSENSASRAPRDASDVQRLDTDGTALSRSERRKMFKSEFQQEALPTPPDVPGYHLCWLSTTSSYDPIHKRMRLGYEPVKASDVPGFDAYSTKSGEWKGFISINEMLLFKIKDEIYQDLMAELHHYQPLEQEEALKNSAAPQGKDNNGRTLASIEGDGLADLGNSGRVPHFH